MNSERKPGNAWESERAEVRRTIAFVFCWALLASLVALLVVSVNGCATTVVPSRVEASEASWDGGSQTSGVLLSTATGFVVTGTFRARYNLLVATYGRDFAPALDRDAGMTAAGEDRWLITKEGMQHHLQMTAWRSAGLKPKNL